MKKHLTLLLTTTLAFSLVTPAFASGVENEKMNEMNLENDGINLIIDSENLVVYQVIEEGVTFEYHESVKTEGDTTEVNLLKYKIEGNRKTLMEDNDQVITEINDHEITVKSNGSDPVVINLIEGEETTISNSAVKEPTLFSTAAVKYQKGGSYVSDVRYEIQTSGKATAIMNGQSPYYKYTRHTNGDFKVFKVHANDLRQKDWELTAITGAIAIADNVIDALRKGQLFSWSLLKKISKKTAKTIPGIGTLYTLYNYAQTYLKARNAYRKI